MSTQPLRYNLRLELLPDWASTAVAAIAGIAQCAPTNPGLVAPGPGNRPPEPSTPPATERQSSSQRGVDALFAALAPYPEAFNAVRDCLNQMFESTPEGTRPRQW